MRRFCGLLPVAGLALALTASLIGGTAPTSAELGAPDTATPPPDRLATPVMPESPTQVDIGRNLYYYHCMPCHGDQGQGLTDEWRQVWVEDHQNCWARGCHAGREGDEGFPLPRSVPAVSNSPQAIANYETADELFGFLVKAHPPQRPGALADDECWALTAFLLHENHRLPVDGQVGPGVTEHARSSAAIVVYVTLGVLLLGLFAFAQRSQRSLALDQDTTHSARRGDNTGRDE